LKIYLLPLFILIVCLSVVSCGDSDSIVAKNAWTGQLTSDSETINGDWIRTNISGIHLRGSHLIDNSISLSGKVSVKICKGHNQSFALDLTGSDFLDEINVKVWRYMRGHSSDLCVLNQNGQYNYAIPSGKTSGDWEELVLKYNNYLKTDVDTVSIFCLFTGELKDTAWFDDFSCEITSNSIISKLDYDLEDLLSIQIPHSSFQQLSDKRTDALKVGVLIKESGDLVDALIDTMKVKVRLKGDWTDHLEGENWSLRIEPESKFRGMSKFSIQTPLAKNMLNEWVFRKLLASENVLTPYYDFIPYQLNENPVVIMAITDHFTADLLESQSRIPGPILKFDEDVLWQMRAAQTPSIWEYPVIESSEILIYSKFKYKKGKAKKQASKARSMLYAHQHNLQPLDSIFNIDLLAKYFAICELAGASHSYLWHNTRYYYNIETKLLEPIGFDGNASFNASSVRIELLKKFQTKYIRQKRFLNLVSSDKFKSKFIHYLKSFSNEKYINNFLSNHQNEITSRETILQKEFTGYSFSSAAMLYRAKLIHQQLKNLDQSTFPEKHFPAEFADISSLPEFHSQASCIAYSKKNKGDSITIQIMNYHHDHIQVIGIFTNDTNVILNHPLLLSSFKTPKEPKIYKIKTLVKAKSIAIIVNEKEYKVEIRKSRIPKVK
jgi:hypothetical protein